MAILSLDQLLEGGLPDAGRRVFVRADLNVPLEAGRIRDDSRVRASLPTLERLRAAGARIVLASHLGRPKGSRVPELSLAPVAEALAEALGLELGRDIQFAADCIGPEVEAQVEALRDGQILLLENLRFHKAETANDEAFARSLASLADFYVNDAFGTAHRAHASTAGMVPFIGAGSALPIGAGSAPGKTSGGFESAQATRSAGAGRGRAAAGLLMSKEIEELSSLLDPKRPFVCFLGGAKVSDKLGVLEALIERADAIGVGGAMAYTFLAAQGQSVGNSLIEEERFDDALRMLDRAAARGCRLLLPTDHVVAKAISDDAAGQIVETIPAGQMGVDIGPETAERYAQVAASAKTILWNGPMGVFEIDAFSKGTERVARGVADSKGRSVVGGGDSLAAVAKVGLAQEIDHLSTGGGASLEFVQGLTLPGIAALEAAADIQTRSGTAEARR